MDRWTKLAIRKMRIFCQENEIDYDAISERFEFSERNAKLMPDGIVSFNLIALVTCPFAGECAGICYTMTGKQALPAGKKIRVGMFKATLHPDFVRIMSVLIKARAIARVRFEDSGDIYSPEYLQKIVDIARVCPKTAFYAYTKSIPFINDWIDRNGKFPRNLKIIQSLGGKADHLIRKDLPVAAIFPDKKSLDRAGFTDTSGSDLPALKGIKKIGLIAHGARAGRYQSKHFLPKGVKHDAIRKGTSKNRGSL